MIDLAGYHYFWYCMYNHFGGRGEKILRTHTHVVSPKNLTLSGHDLPFVYDATHPGARTGTTTCPRAVMTAAVQNRRRVV